MKKAVLLSLLLWTSFHSFAQKTKPNILIILTDDQGYHDVSYYGTPDLQTPNIDGLCKQGMRFDNFYANSCVCSPSRASIMSGRYPEMVGVPGLIRNKPEDNFGYLTPGVQLLPDLLKKAAYKTAVVGKWNLGLESPNLPNEKGFDYFHGWLDDMMEDYWKHLRNGKNFLRENGKEVQADGHATDLFTQWAIDYLHQQKNSRQPFFLYLAYTAPHAPLQPAPDFLAKVKERQPQLSDKRAKLVALIEQMDDGIGKVVKTLKDDGLYDNTLIFFVSDNGGQLQEGANNGPVRDGKGSMYEGGLKVPGFAVWPNHIKAGTQSSEKLLLMDIYPTVAEITGATVKHKIDGVSFWPILKNSEEKMAARPLFFSRREGFGFQGKTSEAVINGDMKLLQNGPFQPLELYNLRQDPMEQTNLMDKKNPQRQQLQQLLMGQIQKAGSVPWQKPQN